MMTNLNVRIEGFMCDHEEDSFHVLDPVYEMLDAARKDGLIADYNWSDMKNDGRVIVAGADEDPTYVFIVAGVTDFGELRRRAYTLASSAGPDNIIDCDVE